MLPLHRFNVAGGLWMITARNNQPRIRHLQCKNVKGFSH